MAVSGYLFCVYLFAAFLKSQITRMALVVKFFNIHSGFFQNKGIFVQLDE